MYTYTLTTPEARAIVTLLADRFPTTTIIDVMGAYTAGMALIHPDNPRDYKEPDQFGQLVIVASLSVEQTITIDTAEPSVNAAMLAALGGNDAHNQNFCSCDHDDEGGPCAACTLPAWVGMVVPTGAECAIAQGLVEAGRPDITLDVIRAVLVAADRLVVA